MGLFEPGFFARAAVAAGAAIVLWGASLSGASAADEKTYTMKISLPTLNDSLHQYGKNLAAAVEKDSGGRIKAEVYPASQLGSVPRQIEGAQFGAIECVIEPPEYFTGLDERFEVMAAPGLVNSMDNGERVAADSAVTKLMFSLGESKGLHGVAMFMATPSQIVSRTAIRHLADFKGKKLRIFSSDFQSIALQRLGATPIAMTLGDVLPAIQQGTIDGAIAALAVYVPMHYQDAAKYVTNTGQPSIFLITELSKKWLATLPPDLPPIIEKDAGDQARAIHAFALDFNDRMAKAWTAAGGELIDLPPDEQAKMLATLSSVGADVSKNKPALAEAYKIVSDAAQRTR